MSRMRHFGSEHGSLPLALLVTIIVAGVVVVMVARTAAGQRQVQFDQAYHGALPVADVAADVAKFRLNNEMQLVSATDGEEYGPEEFPIGHQTVTETHEVDGRTYTWSMTREGDRWVVDSTATDARGRRDVSRRVQVELQDQPLILIAAFADVAFQLSGGNTADSYTSDPAVADANAWCEGRQGFVGSNNRVTFDGSASPGVCAARRPSQRTVDKIVLYDWAENPGQGVTATLPGGNRCGAKVGQNVDPNHANCKEVAHAEGPFPEPALVDEPIKPSIEEANAFINDALDTCEDFMQPFGQELGDFRSTKDAGTALMPAGGTHLAPAPDGHPDMGDLGLGLKGRYYCYNNVFIDSDTTIDEDASIKDPVIIFVKGNLHLAAGNNQNQRVQIGCGDAGCTPGVSRPEAGRLWFFVLGEEVAVRAQSHIAGVLWAPKSDCGGIGPGGAGGTSSQVDFYGSLICRTVSNNGGWRFHYDEALGDVTDGQYVRTRWQELPS